MVTCQIFRVTGSHQSTTYDAEARVHIFINYAHYASLDELVNASKVIIVGGFSMLRVPWWMQYLLLSNTIYILRDQG